MNLFDLNDYDDEFYFAKGWPSRSKIHEKNWGGGQIWAKRAKIGPEITEEILNEKLHFLFSEITSGRI